jgi:hypothetical protein
VIAAEALAVAVEPAAAAASRLQAGSSAPGEVAAMVADARRAIAAGRRFSEDARAGEAVAREALLGQARALAGRPG